MQARTQLAQTSANQICVRPAPNSGRLGSVAGRDLTDCGSCVRKHTLAVKPAQMLQILPLNSHRPTLIAKHLQATR